MPAAARPAPPNGFRRSARGVGMILLIGTVLASGCSAQSGTVALPRDTGTTTSVQPPAASPQTPTDFRSDAAVLAEVPEPAGPTGAPSGARSGATTAPTGSGGSDPFCSTVRSGLSTLTAQTVQRVVALAGNAGASVPQLDAAVQRARTEIAALRAAAPAALQSSISTLSSAWANLAADLARNGHPRTAAVALTIKYLAGAAATAAWAVVSGYAASHCNADTSGP
jgi:hypothetical protein